MTREEINAYNRERYAKNRDKQRAYSRAYYKEHYARKAAVPPNMKKVVQIDYYTGEYIDEYNSIKEAAEDNYISTASISKTLNRGDGKLNKLKLAFKFAM